MKKFVRLGVWSFLFVLVPMAGVVSNAQAPAVSSTEVGTDALSRTRVFPYDRMTVTKLPNGGEMERVVQGTLKTGEAVAVHESMQPAGIEPNPAHRINHSEFIVVREGTVQFEHDGKAERVDAGGIIYVAFGTMHRLRNVGKVPARYVVIAIGGDTK